MHWVPAAHVDEQARVIFFTRNHRTVLVCYRLQGPVGLSAPAGLAWCQNLLHLLNSAAIIVTRNRLILQWLLLLFIIVVVSGEIRIRFEKVLIRADPQARGTFAKSILLGFGGVGGVRILR